MAEESEDRVVLYWWPCVTLPLQDAIVFAAGCLGSSTGLAYARQAAWFEAVNGAGSRTSGLENGASEPYEYRLFSDAAELRWLLDPNTRTGTAVLVSEKKDLLSPKADVDGKWGMARELEVVRLEERSYILWGAGCGSAAAGWGHAGEARTGRFAIPLACSDGERVALRFVEYAACDEHGNYRVVEERLLGLRSLGPAKPAVAVAASSGGGGDAQAG